MDDDVVQTGRDQDDLVSHLRKLTDTGLARWSRRESEPQFVFCFIGSDMIQFEALGAEGRAVDPAEPVSGMTCKYRNITFLWLEGLFGWDALLRLLRAAPVDDEAWAAGYRSAKRSAVEHLRHLAG